VKTLIIAEAGVNHNGDLNIARALVEVAASSGADFVKFQTFKASQLSTRVAPKAKYQLENSEMDESQFEMLERLELSEEMHKVLIKEAKAVGIGFMSTAFDIDSANFLLSIGQNIFKIPSGEITNLPLLRHIASFKEDIILSTGMSTKDEVEAAVNELIRAGTPKSRITVLHCTSSYPAPLEDVNLLAMIRLRESLGLRVGYSDHTLGTEVAVAAVTLGATVIEKHFTLDKNFSGPDHKASLEPKELKLMIEQIRNIEKALGDGVKRPTDSELENLVVARKSIVAKYPISRGDIFSEVNLTTKRPGNGLSPMEWDRVIGTVAHRDFAADELIEDA